MVVHSRTQLDYEQSLEKLLKLTRLPGSEAEALQMVQKTVLRFGIYVKVALKTVSKNFLNYRIISMSQMRHSSCSTNSQIMIFLFEKPYYF